MSSRCGRLPLFLTEFYSRQAHIGMADALTVFVIKNKDGGKRGSHSDMRLERHRLSRSGSGPLRATVACDLRLCLRLKMNSKRR
jgi:hypothetical protein